VNGGRRGGGHFLRRRTYRNKQLCCLVQRAAMVGLGGLPREPIGSDGVVRQTAGREAGRQAHEWREQNAVGAATSTLVQVAAG
jgi:hypothetical protein